jgi:hypothetical protein
MLSSSSAAHHHDSNGKTREDTLLQSDYFKDTFNMGRGATLRAFGNFMASNLGIRNNSNLPANSNNDASIQHSFTMPYRITISIDSSARHYNRDMDHSIQMMARVKTEFAGGGGGGGGVVDNDDVVIQSFDVHQLTLVEQARIAAESAIFVSICGGGSVMATFLSPGASLIVIYDDEQEQQSGHGQDPQQQPTRIDWDLLSNAGYFRAHWLPIQRNHDLSWNIASLVSLMRRELDRIRKQE